MIGGALLAIAVTLLFLDTIILSLSQGTKYTPGPLLNKLSVVFGVLGGILLFLGI